MIKLTMTNGLVYMATPSLERPRPEAVDDEAAWQYLPEVYKALRDAHDNAHKYTNFYIVYTEDLVKALSDIPGVASVDDLDPQPPEKDPAPEVDKKGDPIIY